MGQIIDPENPTWIDNLYLIETTDPVKGGKGGIANRQAEELGERTAYLRAMFDRLFLGRPFKSWDRVPRAGFIRYDGTTHQRANYAKLVKYATDENLFVSQSLKDGDPLKYAAYFGDGDGSTTFSTPNGHLGNVFRGESPFGSFLETLNDAIRNITATATLNKSSAEIYQVAGSTGGAFTHLTTSSGTQMTTAESSTTWGAGLRFDASLVVPTANENRMKSSHVNIDAWAGE